MGVARIKSDGFVEISPGLCVAAEAPDAPDLAAVGVSNRARGVEPYHFIKILHRLTQFSGIEVVNSAAAIKRGVMVDLQLVQIRNPASDERMHRCATCYIPP